MNLIVRRVIDRTPSVFGLNFQSF